MRGPLAQEFLDDRSRGREHFADFGRVFAAGFREVRTAAATTADDGRDLLDDLACRNFRGEVGRDADDDGDLAVGWRRENHDAALDAIAMAIDQRAEAVFVEAADLARNELHPRYIDRLILLAATA